MTNTPSDLTMGILLAAGASRRFGEANKLLAGLDGKPLLRHAADTMLAAGFDHCMAVTSDPETAAALPAGMGDLRLAAGQDMAASFRRAVACAEAANASKLVIALADMPRIGVSVLRQLLARDTDSAAQCGTRRLPPVMLLRASFSAVAARAAGDAGARDFIRALPRTSLLPISEAEAEDVDFITDLQRLTLSRQEQG